MDEQEVRSAVRLRVPFAMDLPHPLGVADAPWYARRADRWAMRHIATLDETDADEFAQFVADVFEAGVDFEQRHPETPAGKRSRLIDRARAFTARWR